MFSDRSPYDEARGKGLGKMVDDVLYCLFFALSAIISSMFSFAQFIMFSTSGRKERARGVRLYSTRGGISGKTSRLMKPSSLRVRSVCVSDFCEMSGISRCSSLKRIGSLCCRLYSTRSDHLSPTRARTLRIGQSMNNASLTSLLVCSFFSSIICLTG